MGFVEIMAKIKDVVLGRSKSYQIEIDRCVEQLEDLLGLDLSEWSLGECFMSVKAAFSYVFSDKIIYEKVDKDKKKGFDGFVNYIENSFGHAYDWSSWINGDSERMLKILKNVKRYRAPRSRVNALIGPCEKLYKEFIIRIAAGNSLETRAEGFFDFYCYLLLKASKADKGDTFWAYIVRAFRSLRYVASIESKQGSTTFGRWYDDHYIKVDIPPKRKYVACPDLLRAILHMNDKKYQSNGGFWKWLRKGGTKMQRASKLIKAVEKRAEELGLIKDGKVIGEK